MGIVQFTNYLRPVQYSVHVSTLNELLMLLDNRIVITGAERQEGRVNFDNLSSSTELFETIEVYREVYGEIWKVHQSLNHCFGFSILVITMNAYISAAFTLYFSVLSHAEELTFDFIAQPALHTFHIAILFVVMVYNCECSNAMVN